MEELGSRLLAGRKASFILRYLTETDRRLALHALDNWNPSKKFTYPSSVGGSELPIFGCFFDAGEVLRALLKTAVNLLVHWCPNTPINHTTVPNVVRLIMGDSQISAYDVAGNGFVHAADVTPIATADKSHSFRLLHDDGIWYVYSSYFGGRIGSVVRFPGPNRENWRCADLIAPLNSRAWEIRPSEILQPIVAHVDWQDARKIIPSIKLLHTESKMFVVPAGSRT
jgi:hypothetical protein